MATVEADRLTLEFQQRIAGLAQLLARRVGDQALRADAADIDRWWQQASPRLQREVLTGQAALSVLARRYYEDHARLEGVNDLEAVPIEPNAEQIATALRVTGPVAFKEAMTTTGSETAALRQMVHQLTVTTQRLALIGPRQTGVQTSRRRGQVAGWRRVTGPGACPFCRMLRGRGAVYGERTVWFRAHGTCHCGAELVYRQEPEPPDVRLLQQQWREATAGHSGPDALRAWNAYARDPEHAAAWDSLRAEEIRQAFTTAA